MNKFQVSFLLLLSSLFIIGSSQEASAFVINFETFGNGNIIFQQMAAQIPGGPAGLGVTIYADNFNDGNTQTSDENSVPTQSLGAYLDLDQISFADDLAVIFDSTLTSTQDVDLEDPFTSNFGDDPGSGSSPGNILIIQELPLVNCTQISCDPDDEADRPNGQFIFVFTDPVAILSIDVFDVEESENDPTDILFYDENDQFLSQFSNDDVLTTQAMVEGDNKWRQIDLNAIRVKTMIIEWPGSGAIDNIVYDVPVGGKIIPTSVSLFVGEAQPDSFSILGAFTLVGAVSFGALYYTTRRNFV